MTYEELKTKLQSISEVTFEEKDSHVYVTFSDTIELNALLDTTKMIYGYEKELHKNKQKVNIVIRAKSLETEKLEAWFRMALQDEDLCDPVMCLNIFNLVKNYNALSENFFENNDIYITNIEQFLDIKLGLKDDISRVSTKLAKYFISLIKYAHRTTINSGESVQKIENLYSILLTLCDVFTLSGIVAKAEDFKISECVLVYDAMTYLMCIMDKTKTGINLMEMFLKGKNSDDNSTTKSN